MKILSIDCGIKTLSFCLINIFNYAKEKKEISEKILKSDFTEMQKNNLINKLQEKDFDIILWKKINLCELSPTLLNLKCKTCSKKAKYHYQKKGYCKKHNIPSTKEIKEKKAKSISIYDLNKGIIKAFECFPEIFNSDYILIENQPSKNPRMNIVQNILYTYFIMKNARKIINVSPKYKLRGICTSEITKINSFFKSCPKKSKYDQRKYVSVQYTRYLLNQKNNTQFIEYFEENKKKQDDLADCFLQAINYSPYLN
jgi:hypothetical protein